MTTTEIFLIAMTIILCVPYVIWRLLRTDYYAPLVVVQIIVGVLLGPGVLGAAFPEYHALVFNPEVTQTLSGISLWAVMLFVFIAGIELDLEQAWKHRAETTITAGLALGVPLAFGCVAAAALLGWRDGWMGASGHTWQFVASVGMACAVTALPVLILLLEKLEILRAPLGQRALRYASLDDVAIWAVLAMILMDWERVGRQGIFLVGFAAAALGLRRLMRALEERDRWFVMLIWLTVCGFAADWAGLHFMVGAFLAGVVLDAAWFNRERLDLLRHHILLIGMPVYFLSTGLRTSWSMGSEAVLVAALVLLVAATAGKLLGVHLAGAILRWRPGVATTIGWLLQTKGLVMIVFVNILLDKGIISSEIFTALLLMAIVSTILTVPLVAPRLARAQELVQKPL